MKRKEELETAAVIVACFAGLILTFACLLNGRAMIDFLLCRKWSQTQVKDYTNLNDLLFDADEKQVGRLADNTEEITVGSFFCDILKVKEIPKQHNQLIEEHLNNTSRFSEPLL